MPWISKEGSLSQSEMENNANIVINYYRTLAYADATIAALLGNMQNESTINPARHETGGQGYGLVQWTPQSVLIEHAANIGITDYENGDNQLAVIHSELMADPAVNNEWYSTEAFIRNYYQSGATADMVGVTAAEFMSNAMGWQSDKLAVLFMAAYERPAYDPNVNHYQSRMEDALWWFDYMGGVIPPTPGDKPIPGWNAGALIQWGAIAESIRRRRKNHV